MAANIPINKSGVPSQIAGSPESNVTNEGLMLDLIRELLVTLAREEISYCHWKSNAALERSANGDNDLDLLVGRGDAQRFCEILDSLDFKEARSLSAEKRIPGIQSFFGYDMQTGKFVHVHAHYQLILGHDMTKNYRLPVERAFLASATSRGLFYVPAPEFEFIVFVIRMMLKHWTWDAILSRRGRLSASERKELDYLDKHIDQGQVMHLLREHFSFIGVTVFENCRRCLQGDASMWMRSKTGLRLQRVLETHTRRSQFSNTILKIERRAVSLFRRRVFLKRMPKKNLARGGAIIALIGGDGAGKSTAVKQLNTWLSQDFNTLQVHIGRPPRSGLTRLVDGLLKIGREIGKLLHKDWSVRSVASAGSPILLRQLLLLRLYCIARDRYRAYVRAQRFAINGGLVICDRYHISTLTLMESAQIRRKVNLATTNRFARQMMHAEEDYYERMALPDLLIVLRVDPEVAVQRRLNGDIEVDRLRAREIWELDWLQLPANVIDAGQSQVKVISEIKTAVWSHL